LILEEMLPAHMSEQLRRTLRIQFFLRDDVLSSLMNHNHLDNFEAPSDDMMFAGSEGWNVAGNVFSDFTFTGENNDASLWDWDHH
jgi:hypothetical protein